MYVQETKPYGLLSSAPSQTFGTFGCMFGKSKPYVPSGCGRILCHVDPYQRLGSFANLFRRGVDMQVTENQSAAQTYYSPGPESLGSGIPVGSAIRSLNHDY